MVVRRLDAGKMTGVEVRVPERIEDSLYGEGDSLLLELPSGTVVMRAFLVQDQGSDAGSRSAWLSSEGFGGVAVIGAEDGPGSSTVGRTDGDGAVLERLWSRGGGEALILSASAPATDPAALHARIRNVLLDARQVPWEGLRQTPLSDTGPDSLRRVLGGGDVSEPPSITHRMRLDLIPQEQAFAISDTFTVDFSASRGTESIRLVLPHIDASAAEMLSTVSGTCSRETDSVLCMPDPVSRSFTGIYQARFDGFSLERDGLLLGQVRLSSSFCSETWFYPGSGLPASYLVTASVPYGGAAYLPLDETGRSTEGSLRTFRFSSPGGGITGPLAWAAGDLHVTYAASGRSRLVYDESIPDSVLVGAAFWADRLASVVWDRLGFEGGRLDLVIVETMGQDVLSQGPGCLLATPGILASLEGVGGWDDSLSAGTTPRGCRVPAAAAAAMLNMSTHLSRSLRLSISAWAVYLFAGVEDPDCAAGILDAFRLFYLSATASSPGVEYAPLDPLLEGSACEEPVLLGKVPCILSFLSRSVPGFAPGLQRALGSLRHPGISALRIESATGIYGDAALEELYWDWLARPGCPQVLVAWSDSGGRLDMTLQQLQPGSDFPLPLGGVEVTLEDGEVVESWCYASGDGTFWAPFDPRAGEAVAIDLSPLGDIPADFVYHRVPGSD
jgi:hypothetical protein